MGCAKFFFFNDTATTEIYTLSLHDALPILHERGGESGADAPVRDRGAAPVLPVARGARARARLPRTPRDPARQDRKSTRLNSSHANISYAVFCLKKKNQIHRSMCEVYEGDQ